MSHWNASNYQKRVAERIATIKPQWITMPSGEKFYLRQVAAGMSSALAGAMPNALTKQAVDAWKEDGVEGFDEAAELVSTLSPEQRQHNMREFRRLAGIVQQACVIPLLSNDDPATMEFTEEWKVQALEGLKEDDKDFDVESFDPKMLVANPQLLDDADAKFLLYEWATGAAGPIGLKGGGAVHSSDLLNFRQKKLNRGSRTRGTSQKHRKSA